MYNRFVKDKEFTTLENVPYVPVRLFKELKLITGPDKNIKQCALSSSTTGKPSKIYLDIITMNRQRKALLKILIDLLGKEKVSYIIFDNEETTKTLNSRGTAIRGFIVNAKSVNYVLREDLSLASERLINIEGPVCVFGFTWLLYKSLNSEWARIIKPKYVIHIGGWKKLTDQKVTKQQFNHKVESVFGTTNIIDIYGMTEQLGTVYPDCECGYKHVPLYSEILIRDPYTLRPIGNGKTGLLQFISPIPHSYPGISLLTDDLGTIVGVDDCKCGRKGKYFVFNKRLDKAELKGCGDTIG